MKLSCQGLVLLSLQIKAKEGLDVDIHEIPSEKDLSELGSYNVHDYIFNECLIHVLKFVLEHRSYFDQEEMCGAIGRILFMTPNFEVETTENLIKECLEATSLMYDKDLEVLDAIKGMHAMYTSQGVKCERMLLVVQFTLECLLKRCSSIDLKNELLDNIFMFDFGSENTLEKLLKQALTSSDKNLKFVALHLIYNFSKMSLNLCHLWLPVLIKSLLVESSEILYYVIFVMWNLVFLHPSVQRYYVTEDLDLLTILIDYKSKQDDQVRYISAVGLVRLLENDAAGDYTEDVMNRLIEIYCSSDSFTHITKKKQAKKGIHHKLTEYLYQFLEKYHHNKSKHQEEIANTITCILLNGVDQGLIPYNGSKHEEAFLKSKLRTLTSMLHQNFIPEFTKNLQLNIQEHFKETWSDKFIASLLK
ncbi:hypothetical protein AKO1_007709 [Acrasis kona]|uniref:Uncharacterized protein n=1 Tax=Acrasis kona TaxID=1008807 RepID=A0AAW2YRP8_9EUKA